MSIFITSQPRNGLLFFITVSLWLTICIIPSSLSAEESKQSFPQVFQPDETQHGFSEFESLPEIYPASPPKPSQNENNLKPPIDPEQPPEGLFYRLDFAKEVDDDEGIRRGHFVVPVNPTRILPADGRPVFLVFRVHQHFAPYEVFGELYAEKGEGLDPATLLDKDAMHLATEDDSGYLQFDPPSEQWPVGTYRVKIFVGFEASQFNLRGTMRFSIAQSSD